MSQVRQKPIRAAITALSVLVALTLIATWIGSYRADFIAFTSRTGSHHELRIRDGRLFLTKVAGITAPEQAGIDRIPKTSAMPWLFAGTTSVFRLRGGDSLMFSPATETGVWPIRRATGGANVVHLTADGLSFNTSSTIGGNVTATGTLPISPPASGTVMIGNGTVVLPTTTSPSPLTITSPGGYASSVTITGGTLLFPTNPYEQLSAPMALPVLIALTPVAILAARWLLRRRRTRLRVSRGLCASCGYDLRGQPDSACPECGEQPIIAAPIA